MIKVDVFRFSDAQNSYKTSCVQAKPVQVTAPSAVEFYLDS